MELPSRAATVAEQPIASRAGGAVATRGPRRRHRRLAALVLAALAASGALAWHRHPGSASLMVAALVDGRPVSMDAYRRQLRFATNAYIGPRAPEDTPAGRTVRRLLENQAANQAVAAVLIEQAALREHLEAGDAAVAAEIAAMTLRAGGPEALRAQLRQAGMNDDDLRWVAAHNVLRAQLAARLHDPAWLDKRLAHATVAYFVGDGAAGPQGTPAIALGHPAPPFVAVDLKGRTVSLADLQGRPVVLEFWASWSGYAAGDLALLKRWARRHPEFAVVAIDRFEPEARVRSYIQAHRLAGLTVWRDTTRLTFADYTVSSVPASFFVDARGIIRSYNFGALADAASLDAQARFAALGRNNSY